MNTLIKQRVRCALLSILLVVVFIGSLLCALVLPFMSSNGVASADSTTGYVGDNLFEYSDFSDRAYWVPSFFATYNFSSNGFVYTHTSYSVLEYKSNIIELNTTYTLSVNLNGVYSVRTFTTPVSVSDNTNYNIQNFSSGLSFRLYMPTSSSSTYYLIPTFDFSSSVANGTFYWVKLEKGSSATGYVPKDYQNYGYNQGVQDGTIQGYNQYVDNYAITSYLNTDTYISLGGYQIVDGDNTVNILSAQNVENHTRIGNEGVATIYDSLLAGVDYNIIYTQGSFSSGSSTTYNGIAGYYAVSSSLLASNGFNSYINAGTPFSLNNYSSRANIDRTSGLYRLVDLSIAFLDKNANIIRFDPTQFENANYYINNNRIFSTSFQSQSIVGDSISSGQVHYYRLPFDIYGILIMSHHESTDYYHAYNMKLQFLPNSNYQDGYNAGFTAGEGNVNTQSYYDNGYNQGYQYGVIKGASEANNYTFLGVIGAMLDAPVNSLLSFLDFNLLGYNMKSFFGALIVFAFVVLIIRLVLGGK